MSLSNNALLPDNYFHRHATASNRKNSLLSCNAFVSTSNVNTLKSIRLYEAWAVPLILVLVCSLNNISVLLNVYFCHILLLLHSDTDDIINCFHFCSDNVKVKDLLNCIYILRYSVFCTFVDIFWTQQMRTLINF